MKSRVALCLLLFLGVLLLSGTAKGAHQLEYTIEVYEDGSATWVIEHRFGKGEDEALFRQLSDLTYFSDTFVKSIKSLVNATREETGRMNMIVENFVMTVSVSGSYSVVKYQFRWSGFAETEDTKIKIGDVFKVEGLFLYGEGTVNIIYPSGYSIESISPSPNAESDQTLTWYWTSIFEEGEPKIVLREKAAFGFMDAVKENAFILSILITLACGIFIGFYYFKLRKKEVKEIVGAETSVPLTILRIEDDEEKVVNLLRAADGSLYQSTIADQCRFSRSKTSKLLATMENKGVIRREKEGREKVVTLINRAKELEKTKGRNSH